MKIEDILKERILIIDGAMGTMIQRHTLEEADFYRNNLHELVYAYDSIDNLCRTVFEDLRRRVTYMDGLPKNQKVILFSPHPDDDVISMGGTLAKLHENANDLVVAYMTSGNIAVLMSMRTDWMD